MLSSQRGPVGVPPGGPPAPARPARQVAQVGPGWDWLEPAVLLVEDDPADALLVRELVADGTLAMRLRWARSLQQARGQVAGGRPDCVLLDLHLPDVQGVAAVEQVRELVGGGVAVVVLTGLAEERVGLAAVAAGAQDYLVKGQVDAELLGRAVRYAIQRKQAEQAAVALQAGQIRAQENARLERGLLPTPLLADGGGVHVVTRYRPGRAQALLGGDFYDVVQATDGTVHALVGDVSGHGPDEAALGVGLRVAWRTLVVSGITGAQQLQMLEQVFAAERTEAHVFATVTSVAVSPDRKTMRVARAGHPGLLLRSAGGVRWVEVPGGPGLGMLRPGQTRWPINDVPLPTDAAVVLFTDGLFEGRTTHTGRRLGEQGLLRLARAAAGLGPEPFVDHLITHAEQLAEAHGGLVDDVAVVHLDWDRQVNAHGERHPD